MYDTLTREQLGTLHELLYLIGQAIYDQLFTGDHRPTMPTISDEWTRLHTALKENSKTMRAVYGEMQRRDQMADAGSRLLADLRIQRGIDA